MTKSGLQTNYVRTKLTKTIAVLGKTKLTLDHESLHIQYSSLVLPYLSNLQPLHILQKRAIRTVHNVGYREHTNTLFLKSHALKIFRSGQI